MASQHCQSHSCVPVVCTILMFRMILCIQFYRLTQLIFSTLFKGIIRKECQSFTNHGHDKTPPTVFSPLLLWQTLPRDMGVSHTLWSLGITRAILACLWFAQGLHKAQKNQSSRVILACLWFAQSWCSGWFYVFNFIGWCNLFFSTLFKGIIRKECQSFTNHGHDITPPTVFSPLSLWLTLPRDMGVSHTLWSLGITRAILACLWFAQGLHKAQINQNSRAVLWCPGWFYVFIFIGWRNLFFQNFLRALSAKNANHLQTTDTLKRHLRYSIHYHCGWPSLGIWGSATHYGLPALPEPFLRACGLHNPDVQDDSMYSILSVDATYFFNITIDKLTIYML